MPDQVPDQVRDDVVRHDWILNQSRVGARDDVVQDDGADPE